MPMPFKKLFIALTVLFVTANAYCGFKDWPCYANTASRCAVTVDGPNVVNAANLQWIADKSPQGVVRFAFESSTGPVLYNSKVYAVAKYLEPNELAWNGFDQTNSQLVAYDANSGRLLWTTIIDAAVWDSWSSPAADIKNNNILVPSGNKVYAINAESGSVVWQAELDTIVLNASVCIASDIPHTRAFITDYDGFGTGGKLYCINLDANEPNNSYNPGEIIWSDTLGSTSGNSPAYKDGVVYVSSNMDAESFYGAIYAYDAQADDAIRKWRATDQNFEGFTGGVTVTKEGFLYAACYNWAEEAEDNSSLCKIDCNSGNIVWITNVERTSSMPVVVGDKIYISGGLDGWGSRPKVEAYRDMGTSVVKLWQTPANVAIGGWSNQPVYANGKLYVGAIPFGGNYFDAYTELYVLDVTADVDSPDFVIAHYTDQACGNNPAVVYDSLYTIGADGLFKFHQPAFLADIEKNDTVDFYDLAELAAVWLYNGSVGVMRADLNLDGKINFADFSLLAESWYGELN